MKDIRITKSTKVDEALTKQLNISELKVIRCLNTTPRTFLVIDTDNSPAGSPEDGESGEPFQYYSKTYLDCLETDDGVEYISLDHRFVKYIQTYKDEQGNTRYRKFTKGYYFAERNATITKRLEQRIVLLAMKSSFLDTAAAMDNLLTRQTIGVIVKKWVKKCDVLRDKFLTPRKMAIMSGTDDENGYVFFMDIQTTKIIIIDVIAGISSDEIRKELQKFEIDKIQYLLTDSNSILVDTLRGSIADKNTTLAVEADSLVPVINSKIMEYMKKHERQIPAETKDYILIAKDQLGENPGERVDAALESRPKLREIYEHVNWLRQIIKAVDRDGYDDFRKWIAQIPEDSEGIFDDASVYIENYEEEILNFYRRRREISGSVYVRIRNLVDKLSRWSERAPDLMRARMLYASIVDDYEDLEEHQWKGLTYEDVMDNIEMLIDEGGKIK